MSRRSSNQRALEKMLSDINPCDSSGDEIDTDLLPDSDSLLTSDEDIDDEEISPRRRKRARVSDGAGAVWHEEQQGARIPDPPVEAHAADGEPTEAARRRATSRLRSFLCFFTPEMLGAIRQWTNQDGQQTESSDWLISDHELMAFVAIVILRGLSKVPSASDCWSANLGVPQIIRIMSRARFQSIMRHLRFDDGLTRSERGKSDKFAEISDLWSSFVSNCSGSYSPGRHITVDEQVFTCKTRCSFLQYTSTQPVKFGLKLWVACDSRSKYVCNLLPCLGKSGGWRRERLSEDVVMRLMEPFLDRGRTVTAGGSCASLALARRLMQRNTTVLGAVDPKDPDVPRCDRPESGESSTRVFSTAGASLTVCAAGRKEPVCVLSSLETPDPLALYSSTRRGVEALDRTLREFTVRKGTQRWPVAVFYTMMDVAALNAQVLHEAGGGRRERRVDFLVELATELAHAHVAEKQKVPKVQVLFPREPSDVDAVPGKRVRCQVRHGCRANSAAVRCATCRRYACGKCRRQLPWQCHDCEKER